MRTNTETKNEFEDRIEGDESEEPGNQSAAKRSLTPTRKVSKKPKTAFLKSGAASGMSRTMPKGKFVTSSRPRGKVAKSKVKNRTGKKYKSGGAGVKHPPTVAQKMKSFGGM